MHLSPSVGEREPSDIGANTVKDALNERSAHVEAGPHAPEIATCPACGGTVDLRGRRTGKNPNENLVLPPPARGRPWLPAAAEGLVKHSAT
jgi:hypothetical protein